jgi:hypothetical protein
MATTKEIIDGVLGKGWYDEWQKMEKGAAVQKKRATVNDKRFSALKSPGATDRLFFDMRLLEAIITDYRKAMNRIARRQTVSTTRVGHIHDVLTFALDVVRYDNDALDAAFLVGIVKAFVAIPFAVFQQNSAQVIRLLGVLKQRLQQAKRERTEAWVQTAINAAVTAITLLAPPIGLIGRAGLLVGQWVLDDALGPQTSKAATAGSKSSMSASQLGDAASEIERLGSKTRRIGKAAGRVATVTGFAFDVNEVLVGYRNVNQVRTAMSQAKKAYARLIGDIKKHKPTIAKFQQDCKRWQVSIKSTRKQASLIRSAMYAEMKRTGYKPRGY